MLKYIVSSILIFMVAISLGQTINFQNIHASKKNFGQVSFGLDLAVMAQLHYGHVFSIRQKPFVLSANAMLPMGEEFLDDFKIGLNFTGSLLKSNNWAVPISVGFNSSFIQNNMNEMATVGTQIALYPGWYKKEGFVAIELFYDKFLVSHIQNSAYYKKAYYSAAKDGWFNHSGGNLRIGLSAGKTLKKGELNLRLGGIFSERGRMPNVPYYGTVGYKFWF
ncbi:MAG: hypothetical protein ACPGVC_09830 [Salibacteraceae bacterium]